MNDFYTSLQRALKGCYRLQALFVTFAVLFFISASKLIAFMIAWESPAWIGFGLFFFVGSCAFPLLAFMGVPLIRSYVRFCQNQEAGLSASFKSSFDQALASFAVFLSIPCAFLVLWILGASDALLKQLPIFGDLWQAFFSFIGLGIALCRILIALIALFGLYLLVPEFALSSKRPFQIIDNLIASRKMVTVFRLKGFIFAIIPMVVIGLILLFSVITSDAFSFSHIKIGGPLWLLSWLSRAGFMSAILTLPLLFFYNVSAEMLRLERRGG